MIVLTMCNYNKPRNPYNTLQDGTSRYCSPTILHQDVGWALNRMCGKNIDFYHIVRFNAHKQVTQSCNIKGPCKLTGYIC